MNCRIFTSLFYIFNAGLVLVFTSIMSLNTQILYLFLLAIPVACISWTVTHEEIFKELREFCVRHSIRNKSILLRKFFYILTCEYCFSHYVTILIVVITNYHLLFRDWRGY